MDKIRQNRRGYRLRPRFSKNMVLLVCSAVLLFSSFVVSQDLQSARAANPGGDSSAEAQYHRGEHDMHDKADQAQHALSGLVVHAEQ